MLPKTFILTLLLANYYIYFTMTAEFKYKCWTAAIIWFSLQ